ncbi:hypothetical protein LSM04_001744 [Trypanosoma melophagium]|uniref:uncharacterized protein n=1 Tax=Trypanosoma melophagium TaxID=715481 RepID=UPI00351A0737|nr:hypothetical protein LSM04_001744 [Trypanosoma melophagium]
MQRLCPEVCPVCRKRTAHCLTTLLLQTKATRRRHAATNHYGELSKMTNLKQSLRDGWGLLVERICSRAPMGMPAVTFTVSVLNFSSPSFVAGAAS